MSVIIITLCITTAIAVVSIRNLGRDDADEMIRLTCTTGALNLETYFDSVENSVEMVSMLVQDSLEGVTQENLDSQIENARFLFRESRLYNARRAHLLFQNRSGGLPAM